MLPAESYVLSGPGMGGQTWLISGSSGAVQYRRSWALTHLISEYGEALLEGELEPVSARHAVARPVCTPHQLSHKPCNGAAALQCTSILQRRCSQGDVLTQSQICLAAAGRTCLLDVLGGGALWKYSWATTPSMRA